MLWKKIVLSSYITLMVSSVLGFAFGILGWPEPTHILLMWVSGLLFAVATILQFKLMEIRKTDTRVEELEQRVKDLLTARKVDKEEFAKMEQRLQTFIKQRFGGLDFSSEKEIMGIETEEASSKNFLGSTATKLLSLIKK